MKSLTTNGPKLRHTAVSPVFYPVLAAAISAALVTLAAPVALAQGVPPPGAVPMNAPATQETDPPGRVARLNYTAGAVTTEPAGATDWSYAQVNRPLTTGDQLWTDKGARSELHIGSTAVRMGESTSLDILNLDDSSTQLKVGQGTLSTRVRSLPSGGSYEIDTPNLALGVSGPGDYRVDVAPDGSTTTVTVRSGSAIAYGDSGQVPIAAGQQIRFAGTTLQQVADNGAPGPDSLDQWAASRDAAEDRSVSAHYVSRDVPGYQDLDANGTWRDDPQYGEVWAPNQVPAGWAPYHDGHWVWQAPWGWTWVDDAPWGFAPYHYGRWAYIGNGWAWVPGQLEPSEPPVYAPALVGFVGDGGGGGGLDLGVSLAIGGVVAAGLAWFPLGPGEPWHPHWGHDWSPRYYESVNRTVIVNNHITNVHNTFVNYRVPGAVTAVPAAAFVHGQPVNHFAQKVDPRQWHNPRFNAGAPGIAPVQQSFGPGLRNAAYRPPAAVVARPVVATRNPTVPAAWHDNLAQQFARGAGGRVPGAGNPVVRTSVPAHFVGQPRGVAGSPLGNVRVVQAHGPAGAPQAGQPQPGINPGRGPQERGVAGVQPQPGSPGAPRPGAPGAARPGEPAQSAAGTPRQPQSPQQAGNGVPHPPQFGEGRTYGAPQAGVQHGPQTAANGQPAGSQPGRGEPPAWTQRHEPMAQQHGGAPQAGTPGRPSEGPTPNEAPRQSAQMPQPQHGPEVRTQPGVEPPHAQPAPRQPVEAQQAPRAPEVHPQPQPEPQQHAWQPPRQEARPPQVEQPHPQPVQQAPRQEFHPQPQPVQQPHPQPVQQAPRQEFHPQPQPVQQPHPQPVQQAPRQEFHPQPQPRPQPAPQQVQQPHPQPQPHNEPRANGGGRDEHHPG